MNAVEALRTSEVHRRVGDYVALAKPGITLMVVVTAGVGYAVASQGMVDWPRLLHLACGTALSAAGAAALNMAVERRLDAKMERTRHRPVPAGRMVPGEALFFGGALAAAGVAYLGMTVNLLTAVLAGATMASYLGVYTPLKVRTSLATLVGAVPGALPPVMGWTAATGGLEKGALVLFLILFFWQIPHFLALAWIYREDYARAGCPVLPVEEPDGGSTGRQVVLQTLALVVVSLVPALHASRDLYLVTALVLGVGFLGFGVAFATGRTREGAWRLFQASVIYLPLLLGALVLL